MTGRHLSPSREACALARIESETSGWRHAEEHVRKTLSKHSPALRHLVVLDAFAQAFNRHDVAAILAAMTKDCVFEASAGPDVCGRRYGGPHEVGKAFAERMEPGAVRRAR